MRTYDIAVLGGGPAGTAVALELARCKYHVVVFEATHFDTPRFGETLPPEVNPLLKSLGVWSAFMEMTPLSSPGIISAWASSIPDETDFIMNRHGCGWHVDRNSFDAMLCHAAAEAGAHVKLGTRVLRCTKTANDKWRIQTNKSQDDIRARFLIDASGKNMLRLSEKNHRTIHDTMIAIVMRLTHDALPTDQRTLIESNPNGWWYVSPLPSKETIAMFFCDPEAYANEGIGISDQLQSAPLTCARLQNVHIVSSHVVNVSSTIRTTIHNQGWAAIGDAAASYDPLSGYGITKALQHASILAEAITNNTLDAYASHIRQAFEAYILQRQTYYTLASRFQGHAFWEKRWRSR